VIRYISLCYSTSTVLCPVSSVRLCNLCYSTGTV
jgi:hypothetical protein